MPACGVCLCVRSHLFVSDVGSHVPNPGNFEVHGALQSADSPRESLPGVHSTRTTSGALHDAAQRGADLQHGGARTFNSSNPAPHATRAEWPRGFERGSATRQHAREKRAGAKFASTKGTQPDLKVPV